MLRCGIVGLPNVGKTTLFNALTHLRAPVENFPFTTVDPNVGIVPVPDGRLADLARVVGAATVTPAAIELVDIAGLVQGAHRGEGLGNEFLSHIRSVDAIIHVVRVFDDAAVVRAGAVSPREDIAAIRAELAAKDAEIRERRRAKHANEEGGDTGTDLAAKPVLYAFNVGECVAVPPPDSAAYTPAVLVSAKIEADIAELPEKERASFLAEYGLTRPRTEEVVRSLLHVLDVVVFFTANQAEARSWLLPRGATAREAAARVHTDFARRFFRADVVAVGDLLAAGSAERARERGRTRAEGKEYVVRDGDVLLFRTRG